MPKRLTYFKIHPNKRPKKIPPRIPTKEQLRLLYKAMQEMSRLAKQIGFTLNNVKIKL